MQALKPSSIFSLQSLDLPYYTCCRPSIYKLKYPHKINRTNGEYILEAGNTITQKKSWCYLWLNRSYGFPEGKTANLKDEKNSIEEVFRFPLYKTITEFKFIDDLTLDDLREIYELRSYKNL
jgi:hypothetical protein